MGYYSETDEVYGTAGVLVGVGTDAMGTVAATRHIVRAYNIINTHLSKRYTVPFGTGTSTPPVIKTISTDLSAYYIMRTLFTKDSQNDSDWVDELKDTAMNMLTKIENGETDLMGTDESEITQVSGGDDISSNTSAFEPVFDMGNELSWRVDPDRTKEISDSKE